MTLTLIVSLALIGFLIGISKTAISGLGMMSAALLATILPAKESTGIMLILLITGDFFAIGLYKKHVEWKFLQKLIVPVIAGVLCGAYFLSHSTDTSLKKTIGWIVIALVIFYPVTQRIQSREFDIAKRFPQSLRIGLGSMAGFMSMVANSGGPPMSIYLLLRRNSVMNFLGNNAWFFFMINVFKVPFTLGLGLLNFNSLYYLIPSIPMVAFGALIGRRIAAKMNIALFQKFILISSGLAGLNLVIR
jgi:uncharacterized membrane protein YfcA